jgi:hypothetical protein
MQAVAYTPRDPAASVLYTVVREHVETLRVEAARLRDSQGLPRFVDAEFDAFLRCGFLAGGFARFRCDACRTERLAAFSCKGRGFCPSCGGRRMAERAAHSVDHVRTRAALGADRATPAAIPAGIDHPGGPAAPGVTSQDACLELRRPVQV